MTQVTRRPRPQVPTANTSVRNAPRAQAPHKAAAKARPAGAGAAWFRSPDFQARLDSLTHSVARTGNSAELLIDGVESFPRRFARMAEADLILMKTYNFREDDTGRKMVQALQQRLEAGAKVFLQFDMKGYYRGAGKLAKVGLGVDEAIPPMLRPLVESGAVLVPTNVPTGLKDLVFIKDHEKYLITWKKGECPKVIMGGMNIGDEWAAGGERRGVASLHHQPGFRDTDIEVAGPVTEDAIQEYVRDVAHHAPDASQALAGALRELESAERKPGRKSGPVTARFVSNRPWEGKQGQDIEKLYCALLSAVPAGETVRLSTPFFLPTDEIVDGLKSAANRGVKFQLLLNPNDTPEAGFNLVARGAHHLYRELFSSCPEGSFEFYEWQGNDKASALHHKLAIFGKDGPVMIGSSNLDCHSLRHNSEGVVLIDDRQVRRDFDHMFEADLAAPGVAQVTGREEPGKREQSKDWFVRKVLRPLI